MATAAFKSTTRRTSTGGDTVPSTTNTTTSSGSRSSSSQSYQYLRRSRSVSRFSHRLSPEEPPSASRKGKFVNTVRGSDFPEISLDDLAIEMFSSSDIGDGESMRGRNRSSVFSEVSSGNNSNTASHRRGRSVSRRGSGPKVGERIGDSNAVSRRRRSLSLVRNYQISDSESCYSTITDDGDNDTSYNANRTTKGVQVDLGQNKIKAQNQLSELARNNSRKSTDSDALKTVSTIRKNYKTKLEESEKRKQELLAEIMLEEERGKELKKIVGDLLPNPKSSPVKRATRGRKRSTDWNKMPKPVEEEVDKIIEDFISSFEETDVSSFDGERSETSSVLGGTVKPVFQCAEIESYKSPLRSELLPVEMDGVVLPWLKWETGNDNNQPTTPRTVLRDTQEITALVENQQSSDCKSSSRGSWSPGVANSFSLDAGEVESCKSQLLSKVPIKSRVDVNNYLKLSSIESFLSETWNQRARIDSGGLLFCNCGKFGEFLV